MFEYCICIYMYLTLHYQLNNSRLVKTVVKLALFLNSRRHIAEKSMGEKDKLRPPAQTDETGLDNMGATTDNDTV